MDTTKACSILNISLPFTDKYLRRQYIEQAKKDHPDKDKENNGLKFIETKEAYDFLTLYKEEKFRIILYVTLENLINADIFVLNQCYYIPLWHEDITFGNNLQVKCIQNIPEHMHIDTEGHLHVNITIPIIKILQDTQMNIVVGEKTYKIVATELKITKHQTIVFYSQGIPLIDQLNIYNTKNRGNVVFHIFLI